MHTTEQERIRGGTLETVPGPPPRMGFWERVLYLAARGVIGFLQRLPLTTVARIGRAGGALAYGLDARHRRVALRNLRMCLEGSPAELRAIAREHFRRLGENYACAIKTASMSWPELQPHCEFRDIEKLLALAHGDRIPNVVVAIGHFGNFELYARFTDVAPLWKPAATYRSLRQPALDYLMRSLRAKSGCRFFERRTQAAALKTLMNSSGVLLGLLADQHAGRGGVRVPFFDQPCSTTSAPAVLALRYRAALFTGFCYRIGLAKWQIHAGDQIPTHFDGKPRSTEDITRDINTAFEAAVRNDPANWFWVHNRWKNPRSKADPA